MKKEVFENIVSSVVVVFLCVVMTVIAWTMVKPVMIDGRNFKALGNAVNNHDQRLKQVNVRMDGFEKRLLEKEVAKLKKAKTE